MLRDLGLLDDLSRGGTVSGAVLAGDAHLFGGSSLEEEEEEEEERESA